MADDGGHVEQGLAMHLQAEPAQMMRYRVVDLSVDGRRALLLDADERVHVVGFAGRGPERDALLSGRRAKLGAHVLVTEHPGVPLHARFESVACSQDEALALMHPWADPL